MQSCVIAISPVSSAGLFPHDETKLFGILQNTLVKLVISGRPHHGDLIQTEIAHLVGLSLKDPTATVVRRPLRNILLFSSKKASNRFIHTESENPDRLNGLVRT